MINTIGKRKAAVARAVAKKGTGKIMINKKPLDLVTPNLLKLKIKEPIIMSGSYAENMDISVNVKGGGINGQADAARQSIARAIIEFTKNKELEKKLTAYDKTLFAYDPRRTEPSKGSRSCAGPRRKRQMSKR
ncbi:MAG: 30S ribosomal protein S9 [Candidatus Aenigmarchaeota archaeon]|nr:30S ribosomal protein S9 [Candidatus Aenigmarchaeota archaeon]